MANVNAPFGLLPLSSATGAAPNFQLVPGNVAYDDSTKIYRGDPLKKLNTGYVAQWSAGTAVSQLAGVFWGVRYLDGNTGELRYSQIWPGSGVVASTAQSSIICEYIPCNLAVPATFMIRSDATGVAFADIGLNADVALGTGNNLTGTSGCYLNATSTLNTTATLPFRIIGLYGGGPAWSSIGSGGVSMGGVSASDTNPYGGAQTGAYNIVVVQANVSGAGSTGI